MTRLRLLAVTSEPPWPLNFGGHLRSFHMLRALSSGFDVTVLCPVAPGAQSICDESPR